MVEASPCASFEVVEANFLFELLVVSLDAPAKFSDAGKLFE